MQLDSIRNCKKKKKKTIFGCKNRALQLNQAKILRIYPIAQCIKPHNYMGLIRVRWRMHIFNA